MHSWIFRNRARLRLIYGPAPEPRQPEAVAPGRPAPREDSGRLVRRGRYVLLIPMPPGGTRP